MCTDFTTDFIALSAFQVGSFEQVENGDWVIHLDPVSSTVPCPVCQVPSTNHARPGRRRLRHRHVPGWRNVLISVPTWRQRCDQCFLTFTVEWPGIPVRGQVTDTFRSMCVARCHGRDFASVSREIGVKYTTLERWYDQEAEKLIPSATEYLAPSAVCLYEFALQKGHTYGINLMDADTGHVWQVTPGRSRKQVQAALKAWPFTQPPEVVVTDLAPGMADIVRQIWPKSTVVADQFHVLQLFGQSLEAWRKLHSTSDTHQRGRHEQRLLHKEPDTLKEEEQQELKEWLEKDPALKELHGSLQSLRAVYRNTTPESGREAFESWLQKYQWSTSSPVKRIAKTLLQWRDAIESYFLYRYTNAKIEGTHNKIKVLKRRAYGYRNLRRFALRIRLECKVA